MHSFVVGKAGVGSGIIPPVPGVHLYVGGNVDGGKTDGETWFTNGASVWMNGICTSSPENKRAGSYPDDKACGSMFVPDQYPVGTWPCPDGECVIKRNAGFDVQPYLDQFAKLQEKSDYWYDLVANGQIIWDGGRKVTLKARDDNCVQVFFFDANFIDVLGDGTTWGNGPLTQA